MSTKPREPVWLTSTLLIELTLLSVWDVDQSLGNLWSKKSLNVISSQFLQKMFWFFWQVCQKTSFLFIILYPSIFSPFDQVSISFLPIYPFSNSSLCLSVSVSWYLFFGLFISIMIPIFMSLSLFSLDIPIFRFSLSLCLSISVSWYLFLFYFFCISIMIPIFLFFVIGTYIFVFR